MNCRDVLADVCGSSSTQAFLNTLSAAEVAAFSFR